MESEPRRVLCVVPPTGKFVREDRCQTPIGKLKTISLRPPIDLLYAAGGFEAAGCQVKFVDYSAEERGWEAYKEDLLKFSPHDVLVSATTLSVSEDLQAVALAKEILSKVRTGAMSTYFQTLDRSTLLTHRELDYVLRGEYESACVELGEGKGLGDILGLSWRTASGEVIRNPDRPFEQNLDCLPLPARHLAKNELYIRPDTGQPQTTIVTNRGCPFTCIYCLANQVAGKRNRYRSVSDVIAEIRNCIETLGIRNFLFRSELFTQNGAWVKKLCEAIVDSNLKISWACNSRVDCVDPTLLQAMKRAGCWIIAYGVESGDQATLDKIEKRAKVEDAFAAVRMTREAGIRSSVYLMIGLPWDTEELIEKQAQFARELDPDFLEVFYPYPFPGTPLHSFAIEHGLLAEGELPRVAYAEPAIPGLYLGIEQLKNLRSRVLRDYYLRPKIVARTLRNAKSPKELWNYIRTGTNQLTALVGN